jgi:outer membrane receptor protein involved in Fe transport
MSESNLIRKPNKSAWLIGSAMTLSAGALFSVSAYAESESQGADGRVLEEVIVTATRRETAIMKTPFSMQAFTSEELEKSNIFEVRDMYNFLPGITMQEDSARTDHTVQMRGSGISSVGADDGQSAVGYYLDDIPYMDITSQVAPPLDYFDVEQVEVLRGPQGTSFGQDSAGGSIRMYSYQPDLDEFGYKVRAGMSDISSVSDQGWKGDLVVNVPIIENKFGLRVSYSKSYDPGYGVMPGYENPNEVDLDSYRIKALWNVNDAVDVTLSRSQWDTEIDFFTGVNIEDSEGGELVMFPVTNRVYLARWPSGRGDNTHNIRMDSLLIKADLGFAELTSTTGYLDAYNRQYNWGTSPFGVGILFDVPNRSFTQEIRLVSTGEGPLQWLGGVYYHDAKSGTIGIVDIDFGGFQQTYVSSTPRFSEAQAIYGEISYEINDQWQVLAGLRYQTDDRDADNIQVDRDPAADPVEGHSNGVPVLWAYTGTRQEEFSSFTFSNWHPRINVTYNPTENGMVYMNMATAFRAPIVLRGAQLVDIEAAGMEHLIPEDGTEITSIEIGTKWTLLDNRLELQGAIATADWEDTPVGVTLGFDDDGDGEIDRNTGVPIGGASARITSFEFHANWAVTDALTLGYVGSYTDGEITGDKSDDENVTSYPPALLDGGDLPNNSKESHSVNVRYEAPLFNTGWRFFGNANYSHRTKPGAPTATSPDLIPAKSSWTSARMNLGASKGPWLVDLSVTNLTDFDEAYLGGSSATTNGMIPRPRSILLQVTYDGFSM